MRTTDPRYDSDLAYQLLEQWFDGDHALVISTLDEAEADLSRLYTAEFTVLLGYSDTEDDNEAVSTFLDMLGAKLGEH